MHVSRGQRRHYLVFHLPVHDRHADKPLGFLGDITPEGMLVVSEQPLDVDRRFELEICGHADSKRSRRIRCRARSVWSKTDVNPDYYATGFQFEEVPAEAIDAIQTLIWDIGFDR